MVRALRLARFRSGFSSPSSKRIMKSTQAWGWRFSADNTGALSRRSTPYCSKIS